MLRTQTGIELAGGESGSRNSGTNAGHASLQESSSCRGPLVALTTVIVGVMSFRLLPYLLAGDATQPGRIWFPWNFSPVTALALFGGLTIPQRWWRMGCPLMAFLASNAALAGITRSWDFVTYTHLPIVLACILATSGVGARLSTARSRFWLPLAGGLVCEIGFFLVTNFFCWFWQTESAYPDTWEGLALCYQAGLPFFKNALLGTMGYLGVLLGGWAWLAHPATHRSWRTVQPGLR